MLWQDLLLEQAIIFNASSGNGGTALIQNDEASCNSLIIKGNVLDQATTVPTNWGTAV